MPIRTHQFHLSTRGFNDTYDGNGFSLVRAALLGPSISLPLIAGEPALGTWQQITLIDFDNRPRERTVIVQVVGE